METTTGLDVDTIPGVDRYLKDLLYRDGFYEDRERAFRGFAQVDVTEPGDAAAPTRVTGMVSTPAVPTATTTTATASSTRSRRSSTARRTPSRGW